MTKDERRRQLLKELQALEEADASEAREEAREALEEGETKAEAKREAEKSLKADGVPPEQAKAYAAAIVDELESRGYLEKAHEADHETEEEAEEVEAEEKPKKSKPRAKKQGTDDEPAPVHRWYR